MSEKEDVLVSDVIKWIGCGDMGLSFAFGHFPEGKHNSLESSGLREGDAVH
jgi:hypothetical protein